MLIRSWLLAFRPKTLTAGAIPVIAASALVYAEHHADGISTVKKILNAVEGAKMQWWISALALLAALFIQIATNLFNDAIDYKKGADTSDRLGPKRFAASGEISYRTLIAAGLAFVFMALLCGIPLVIQGGWPIVAVGLISLCLAYMYTGGPFPLAYLGLGDIFVVLFFGVIAVGGVYYLHVGTVNANALVLGLQVGFLSTVLIAINNLRDVEQDRIVAKKTLAVRFGKNFVVAEIAVLILLTFIAQYFWYGQVGPWSALLPIILLPLGVKIIKQVQREAPSARYNQFLAQSALLHAGFGVLISVGFLLR